MKRTVNKPLTPERVDYERLQAKLWAHGINSSCPYCGSGNICNNGWNNNMRRLQCKDCGKIFSIFTDTLLEKTQFSWDVWVKMTEMHLNGYPLEHMLNVFKIDYGLESLDLNKVFYWKHKIIHAMASMPTPKLKGVIQVDETFFREAQKGSKNLESTVKGFERKPRFGPVPSKLGVMGNEFANVVVAVDESNHCVAEVACLGRLTIDLFYDLFDKHFENITYLCTDANPIYKRYSSLKEINHFILPSNHLVTKEKHGYGFNWESDEKRKDNDNIMRRLYDDGKIEHMSQGAYPYEAFKLMKKVFSLSLSRVNQVHDELKNKLRSATKGVSTKYLADYVGAYVYVHNWSTDNGRYPSTETDAENILIELLKSKVKYTVKEINNTSIDMPKASDRYMSDLKRKTETCRKVTKNPHFKYDEEDNVVCFDTRAFLRDLPEYKIKKLCSIYKIKHKLPKESKISIMMKQPDIHEQIMLLISEYKRSKVSDEDIAALEGMKYAKSRVS